MASRRNAHAVPLIAVPGTYKSHLPGQIGTRESSSTANGTRNRQNKSGLPTSNKRVAASSVRMGWVPSSPCPWENGERAGGQQSSKGTNNGLAPRSRRGKGNAAASKARLLTAQPFSPRSCCKLDLQDGLIGYTAGQQDPRRQTTQKQTSKSSTAAGAV